MKFTNKILAVAIGCAMLAQSAVAGSFGFDAYGTLRTVLPTNAPVKLAATVGTSITNPPVDTFNWIGDFKVDVFAYSNTLANTITLAINTSTDTTNWVALTNFSLASAGTLNITNAYLLSAGNWYYNTNFYVTDNFLYPYSIVTPTSFSSGWSTSYNPENPFTNGFPITLNGNGLTEIGVHSFNTQRYLQFVYTPSGTGVTNATVFSTITTPVGNVQP